MTITAEEVARIAHLARLELREADAARYTTELSGILDLVEQMNDATTDGIEPMAHPLDQSQRLRLDEVTETDERVRYQACAPAVEDGLYLVPKVID